MERPRGEPAIWELILSHLGRVSGNSPLYGFPDTATAD